MVFQVSTSTTSIYYSDLPFRVFVLRMIASLSGAAVVIAIIVNVASRL